MHDLPPNAKSIYKDIRKRVKQKYDKRKEFAIHFAMFVIAMYGIWGVLNLADIFVGVARIFSILWGMGIIAHFLDFAFHELQELAVQRELRRVGILPLKKPKRRVMTEADTNERYMRLSDDGELIDFADDIYDHDDSEHEALLHDER